MVEADVFARTEDIQRFYPIAANDLAQYFTSKVSKIRASTASSPPPHIEDRSVLELLCDLRPATSVTEVGTILKKSSAKQCHLDPAPTWLVKCAGDVLAPVIAHMCDMSFALSKIPDCSKRAIVRPLLKKSTLDSNDPASYRPISNLSFVSKVVEKVVDARLAAHHAARHNLLPTLQSAYRPNHSTETAVICILNYMIGAIDEPHWPVLLDLSAVFDTVDHQILADVLQGRFGIAGGALD